MPRANINRKTLEQAPATTSSIELSRVSHATAVPASSSSVLKHREMLLKPTQLTGADQYNRLRRERITARAHIFHRRRGVYEAYARAVRLIRRRVLAALQLRASEKIACGDTWQLRLHCLNHPVTDREVGKEREQDAVSFADRDVGKEREQDAVSFALL